MRHRHTTPFEMAALKFQVKLPIFVERQWVRHRTFSTNEMSARYSILPEEVYYPPDDRVALQSTSNKQGSGAPADDFIAKCFHDSLQQSYEEAFEAYSWALKCDVTRELSRLPLPVATYTEKAWMGNLHNLLHFLELRLAQEAQWEIRQYAQVIAGIVEQLFPLTWEAFVDYRLEAITFSKQELRYLAFVLEDGDGYGGPVPDLSDFSDRERTELLNKLTKIRAMREQT
jgi:thymidylate synthase (FAD)